VSAIPFPIRSNPGPVKFVGEALVVNCFAEEIGPENRSPVVLVSIPGQVDFATPTDVAPRGVISVPELGYTYWLHGSTLYKVDADGVATALAGTVAGSKPVVMERGPERFRASTVTISIGSPGVVSWINHRLSAGATIQFITDGELPTGIEADTTYYVLASGLTANSFQVSASDGGTAIDTSGSQSGTHTATRTVATYQIVIVSDLATFCLEDDILSFVSLPEAANSVTILANRWIYGCDSGRSFYSELNDATDVGELNYVTAEARPDGLVRVYADRGELLLIGKVTTEIYTPSTDADSPFIPLGGTFINKGCAARDSVASFDNTTVWIGEDWNVYRLGGGYAVTVVSTPAVVRAIKAVADKTTIKAYVDADEGHLFYVLTSDAFTLVFDAATQLWHERKSKDRPDWRAWPYVAAFGKRLVGDKASGTIHELSATTFTEDGVVIRCELTLPDVPGILIHNLLEIDVATGVGLNVASDGIAYDPKVMLTWSDDGGYTWSNERTVSLGKIGEYSKRARFTRLGMARGLRGRRYRIAITDPVMKAFNLGDLKAEQAA
jgi:hypothetical protein